MAKIEGVNKMIKRVFFLFLFLSFLFPSFSHSEGLEEYLKFFSSLSSRLPGSDGHGQAASFIERKFRSAGLEKITREEFKVVVPVEKFAYVLSGNRKIDVHCMWPNLVRTSTVLPEGLEGRLIYGGNGDLRNFDGMEIEGSIVVLDFDTGARWRTLAMLGVKAFIFTDTGSITRIQADEKWVNVPIDVPRFYAHTNSREIKELALKQTNVKLFARMDWENVTDYNIFGYLRGTDKNLKEELIVIQSFYDSVSVVPAIANGATSSTGISVLLDMVDYFKANRPKRTVLFLATSSHYQSMKGMDAFVQKHMRHDPMFRKRIAEEDIVAPGLVIGLNLSDGSDSLGIWHNSYDFYYQRIFAPFGRKFLSYAENVSRRLGYRAETALVNGISPERGLIWQTFLPENIRTDGEYAVRSGNPAISLVTVNDGRWKLDTPADTYRNLNVGNVARQSVFLKNLLSAALNDPDLFPDIEMDIKDVMATLNARVVTFDPRTSFVPSDPVAGAIVIPRLVSSGDPITQKTNMGVRNTFIEMTGQDGKASCSRLGLNANVDLAAFSLNPENGDILLAPDLGVGGAAQYPVKVKIDYRDKDWMFVLFESKAISLFELVDPQYLVQLDKIEVLDMANSSPSEYGTYMQYPEFIPFVWTSYSEPVGTVFVKPATKIKILGQAGPLGKRLLLLNSLEKQDNAKENAEGTGFEVDLYPAILNTPYQGARDMIILDTYRRRNFEQYGIRNERLAELQKESLALFNKASEAKTNRKWYDFLKYSRQSQAVEYRQ